LYVSGEESLQQIRLRGERLGTLSPGLHLAAETDAAVALEHARKLRPCALAVDSIQTLALSALESAPGSVSQVREVGHRLAAFAKDTGTPVILVGHVTKEGSIAGPRVLEHLVDTVLFFEGDRSHAYRVLRAHKNRFGSTNEIGVFEMKSEGLVEVPDASALFLAERPVGASGSAVVAVMNGSRPLLLEVQALVAELAARQPEALRQMKANFLEAERLPLQEFIKAEAQRHLAAFSGGSGAQARARLAEQGKRIRDSGSQ